MVVSYRRRRGGAEAAALAPGRLWFCSWQNGVALGQRSPGLPAAVLLLFEPVLSRLLWGHLWAGLQRTRGVRVGLAAWGGPPGGCPACRLQKLLCFLPIVTNVLLMPTAAGCRLLRGPFQGPGGVVSGPGWQLRLVTPLPCSQRPETRAPVGWRLVVREGSGGPWSVVWAWPLPGVCPRPRGCPGSTTDAAEGAAPAPVPSLEVYRLWHLSPKSLALCVRLFS